MSLSLQFDEGNVIEDFTIVLSKRNHEHYGEIANVKRDTINCKVNMNAADEISFDIYKYVLDESGNKRDERLWNQIVDFRLIWIKELDEYFEINVTLDDSTENVVKSIVGISLCEAELSQTNLYDIEINTENDIARDDYVVTKFYDKDNQKASLLHRVLNKNPGYTIKHVDKSLVNLQRSFSIDGTSVYDFLTGECSEQFNCLFQFDSTDRSISVYDLYTVCGDCGYRGEYEHICPECGSENLYYYGEDTTIYVDKTNLTDEIQITMDAGSVKNCFKLVAGDDYMTSVIRDLNQNGSDYIYYITEDQKKDMPSELVEKIESYDELYASYTAEYEQLIQDIYDTLDGIYYYKHEMMPTVEHAEVTAKTEADKLNQVNMGYLALSSVTSSTSKATVESGLKNYAKVYVKTGFVKVEINQSTYTFKNKGNATWVGNFKVTNYSDDEDIAYSPIITVTIDDNYEIFLKQKIQKKIASENDKEGTVFDVLNIDELSDFKEALKLYCLERLKSFYDAIQAALDILVEVDQSSEAADFYSSIYVPYYNKLNACQSEMDVRQKTVDELDARYKELVNRKNKIQKTLNFNEYLGEELYTTFCAYRREDKYTNSNYISDGMENSELIENGKKFIELAKKELYKSAQKQYTLSSSIHNLLVMPEFKAIKNKFELGNWIRFCADEMLYRLRLISINIQFSDEKKLDVDFSSLTKQIDCMSDVKDVIQSAQSMSSSYSYVAKQAEKGNEANNSLSYLRENGLNSALIDIKNNTDEEITYGKNGLLARSYDDILDDYSPEQFKITHNVMAYTDDNWTSVKMAIGKIKYTLDGTKYEDYGVNADTLIGGKMISGDIYSLNYSSIKKTGTHINLNDGTFSFAGDKLKFDGNELNIDGKVTTGSLTATGGKIANFTISGGYLYNGIGIGAAGSCGLSCGTSLGGNDDWMFWAGNGAFRVNKDGGMFANNASITGTISSSTISGGTIGIGNGNFVVDSNGNLTAKKATISGKITGSIIEGSSFIANADQETPKIIVGDQEDGESYRTEIYCDRIDHILRGGTYKVSLDGYGVSFFESGVRKYSLNFLNDRIQIRDVYSDYVQTKKIVSETIQESFKGYAMCGIDKDHTYHCHWNGSSLQLQVDSAWIWNSSDKRLKKNIKSISEEYIDAIGSVDLVQYNLNRENFSDKELYFGTIAQDVVEELKLRGLNDDNIKLLTKQKQSENDDVFYYGMDYEQFLILRVAYDEERINKLERIIEKIK